MEDFSHMFPRLEREVIESVLRSNNGAVDITIDQLLVLDQGTNSLESSSTLGTPNSNQIFPPSPFPVEQPPPFGEDNPPPYSHHRLIVHSQSSFSKAKAKITFKKSWKFNTRLSLQPVTERRETEPSPRDAQDPFSPSSNPPPIPPRPIAKRYKPALLGPLPDDFLRMPSPTPPPQPQSQPPQQISSNDIQERLMENRRQRNSVRKNDKRSQQRLEDERIALLLQNEVFLDELRRNPDFIASLDTDYRNALQATQNTNAEPQGAVGGASGGAPEVGALVDNEDVRSKLPHMGKSTKTKLSTIAKKFNKKKRKSTKVYPFIESGHVSLRHYFLLLSFSFNVKHTECLKRYQISLTKVLILQTGSHPPVVKVNLL
ncbi:putative CUE domain-containing protein 1-like [Apostichopus japonicus]|uniref:Putative CUE domain-containing protein 1-like n=1 Tax=Stichopus japonicus TaxID=307972 RepID=A0A2G8KDZ5_STIJA|nr:putative CUE domain-containing protein 1-like [Apostichopus japonicus]